MSRTCALARTTPLCSWPHPVVLSMTSAALSTALSRRALRRRLCSASSTHRAGQRSSVRTTGWRKRRPLRRPRPRAPRARAASSPSTSGCWRAARGAARCTLAPTLTPTLSLSLTLIPSLTPTLRVRRHCRVGATARGGACCVRAVRPNPNPNPTNPNPSPNPNLTLTLPRTLNQLRAVRRGGGGGAPRQLRQRRAAQLRHLGRGGRARAG